MTASRLLTDANVAAAIIETRQKVQAQAGIDAADILRHVAQIALAEVDEPIKLNHKLRALAMLFEHLKIEDLMTRVDALEATMQQALQPRGPRRVS